MNTDNGIELSPVYSPMFTEAGHPLAEGTHISRIQSPGSTQE